VGAEIAGMQLLAAESLSKQMKLGIYMSLSFSMCAPKGDEFCDAMAVTAWKSLGGLLPQSGRTQKHSDMPACKGELYEFYIRLNWKIISMPVVCAYIIRLVSQARQHTYQERLAL
jgi:hypothetical protein